MAIQENTIDVIKMRKPTRSEINRANGAKGLEKRYRERMKIIEQLHEFGGIQPNYRTWETEHLKILLQAWKKK